jgi:hypothetical protein
MIGVESKANCSLDLSCERGLGPEGGRVLAGLLCKALPPMLTSIKLW